MIAIAIVLIALVLIALLFTPRFNPKIYQKLLFSPVPYRESEYNRSAVCGFKPNDVYIKTKSGNTIHGWYFEVEGATQVVLLSHGNAGNVGSWGSMATLALKNGLSCLVYDYRGYGLSDGVPTPSGIVEDGLTAFDYLTNERGFKPENVVLFGISMGTGVTCQIAKQRKHTSVILQSGYCVFRDLTIEVVPISRFVPKFLFFKQTLDNSSVIGKLDTPTLIFHGAQDELIVVQHAYDLYEAASDPKELMVFPEGKHSEFGSHEATHKYATAINKFLQKHKPADSRATGLINC